MNNIGGASVITHGRKGKKMPVSYREREEQEKCERKNLCRHQGQWRSGRRCSRHCRRDSLASYGEYHGEAGCSPAVRGGPWSIYPLCRWGKAHTGAGSWQELWPAKRSPSGARFPAGPVALGRPMQEQSVPEEQYPMEKTHAGALLEELHPMESTHTGKIHGGPYPMGGTSCWSKGTAWRGRNSRNKVLRIDQNSHPLALLRGKEVENSWGKLSLGRREEWAKPNFRFCFMSHYPTLSLISNKLH